MATISVKERRGTKTVRGDLIWMKHLVGFQIRHLFFRGDDPTDESDSKSIVLLAALPNIEIKKCNFKMNALLRRAQGRHQIIFF